MGRQSMSDAMEQTYQIPYLPCGANYILMIRLNLWAKILITVVVCLLVGFLSGLSTSESIETWYAYIEKPSFNPPNWIFAPVWTLLYILMGIAVAVIWHTGWSNEAVQNAIMIFLAQLIFNATWSVVFFGMQSPMGALVIILILWTLILICLLRFYSIRKSAFYLMIPYFLWVSFATVLNASIVYLNR